MISLKDISAACGVSISTVSKALNDAKDVSPSTRELVLKAARDMGYRPNSIARALKTGRSNNIGILFADPSQRGVTHEYFSQVLDGFIKTVEEAGYDITWIGHHHEDTVLDHIRTRALDGVLVMCINNQNDETAELIESEIPVVTVDYVFNSVSSVVSNNSKGMEDLVSYVIAKGHRRIAYIHGGASAVNQSRLSSFYRILEQNNIEVPEDYVIPADYRRMDLAHEATKKLLSMEEPPTCILYPDDIAAFGGINAIHELGLGIPEDISIAGFDGIPITRYLEPHLTTLWQDTEQIGAQAAIRLMDTIEKPKTAMVAHVIVDGRVYEGNSIKDLNQ